MANSIFNQVSSLGPSRSPLVRGGNGSGSRVGTWAGVMSRSGATVLPLIGCGWGNAPGLYPCGQGRTGRSGHCACPGAFLRDLPTSSFGPLPPTSGGLPKSEKSPCFLPGPGRHENVAGPHPPSSLPPRVRTVVSCIVFTQRAGGAHGWTMVAQVGTGMESSLRVDDGPVRPPLLGAEARLRTPPWWLTDNGGKVAGAAPLRANDGPVRPTLLGAEARLRIRALHPLVASDRARRRHARGVASKRLTHRREAAR